MHLSPFDARQFFFRSLCVFFVPLACSISDEHCSHLRAMRKVLAFVKRFSLILGVAAKLILLLFIGVFHLIPLWCYCFFLSFACMKQWQKKPLLNTRVPSMLSRRLSFTLNKTQSNIEWKEKNNKIFFADSIGWRYYALVQLELDISFSSINLDGIIS